MGRRITPHRELARNMGAAFGMALGEGLVAGLAPALGQLDREFKGMSDVLMERLRELTIAALAACPTPAGDEAIRQCAVDQCERKSVARGMCRRHYAQHIYQERRERLGARPRTPPRVLKAPRKVRPAQPVTAKIVAAVAPTVRRKGAIVSGAPASPAVAPETAATHEPISTSVQVDDVARFFGLK